MGMKGTKRFRWCMASEGFAGWDLVSGKPVDVTGTVKSPSFLDRGSAPGQAPMVTPRSSAGKAASAT
jgi:hypothetical protein